MTEITQALANFAMWALVEGSWQGCDIDGGAAQDKAVELGLIVETVYDPAAHGENSDCEPGDAWFVPTEAMLSALSPQPQSAPRVSGSLPSGESDPSVKLGSSGADTAFPPSERNADENTGGGQ